MDNKPTGALKFPYENSKARLESYDSNDRLADGFHFDVFKYKLESEAFGKNYGKLKYIVNNFPGLVSKVAADMLFSEPPRVIVPKGDQDWIDNLIYANELEAQFYEGALAGSRRGDTLFKVRVGYLNPDDTDTTVIIEEIDPSIWFPHIDPNNVRARPKAQELAWKIKNGDTWYLRKEIHYAGRIENELWLLNGDEIAAQVPFDQWADKIGSDAIPASEVEDTGIEQNLIIRIPNWRNGRGYFGKNDYDDIMSLVFALNNRFTKNDNILDKHSDPILALPEGVLNEEGEVDRAKLGVFEVPSDGVTSPAKPEYIVWNANLDVAMKHIDKLIEALFMYSETAPEAFGMGQEGSGAASAKALKLKLLRLIAKVKRKRLYWDRGIKEVLYVAQLLAKANGVKVEGATLSKEPVRPEIDWQDGLPADTLEAAQEEQIRLASGTTSTKQAIQRLDSVDEDTAEETMKEIDEEKKASAVDVPGSTAPNVTTSFNDAGNSSTTVEPGATPVDLGPASKVITQK